MNQCRKHFTTEQPCPWCHQESQLKPSPRLEVREMVDNRWPAEWYLYNREKGIYTFTDEELEDAIKRGVVKPRREE